MLFLCDSIDSYFRKEYFSAAVGIVFAIWNWNDVVQELTKTDPGA